MRRLLVLAFAILAACRHEAPPPARQDAATAPLDERDERASLTNVARGATIVSRSGEAYLDSSAAEVIDGDPATYWMNPPRDLPQSIVIALPARARIDRVGLRTSRVFPANHVQFETSVDGAAWRPLITVKAAISTAAQWFDVAPVDAAQLRVTVLDTVAPNMATVRIHSVLAHGTELEPPRMPAFDGCWSFNGRPAVLTRRGARATGALAIGAQPLYLDGGSDGRTVRFVWIRGNDYGLALMTVAPDGKHLTVIEWHEEAIALFRGEPWFGQAEACPTAGEPMPHVGRALARPAPRDDVALALLRRIGRYSAFGLRFNPDGTLDAEASREQLDVLAKLLPALRVQSRIVVHEFREATPQANKARAQRELDAVRAALGSAAARTGFVAAGSDAPRQQPATEAARVLYSSVDLEIRR